MIKGEPPGLEIEEKSVLEIMYERAERASRPLSAHFELTWRCNLKCRHCYICRGEAGEMTTPEVKSAPHEGQAPSGGSYRSWKGGAR